MVVARSSMKSVRIYQFT